MFEPGFTMYSRTWEAMKRTNCEFCGKPLSPHQAASSGICGAPRCHAQMIEKVGTELIARKRRENAAYQKRMRELVKDELAEALATLGVAPDAPEEEVAITAIPWQGMPVEKLPSARRAAFEAHLKLITDRAFLEPVEDADLAYRADLEADEPPVMAAACAGCQGGCCALGGDTGFLHDVDVQRYRQRHPDVTQAEVIARYLALLPETSVRDACVFQSERGCTLPRDLRNDQCNAFYCKSLKRLQDAYARTREGKAVLIAADDGEPRNVVAFDPVAGRRVIAEFEPGDKAPEQAAEPVETVTISSEDLDQPI